MSKKIVLYYLDVSPPSRAVLLCGAELGIKFELIEVNFLKGEHTTPEFIKKNPAHTIPVIEDNGVFISDSHAICAYLVGKYGESDRLYPKDLVKRALVDSRLHFDSGHLFCRMRMVSEPVFFAGAKTFAEDRIEYLRKVYDILNRFLEETPYVCGNEMTIADFCLVASASTITETIPFDPVAHKNILDWIDRMSKLPYYEQANGIGARKIAVALKDALEKNQAA